jgi:hypothetical protein
MLTLRLVYAGPDGKESTNRYLLVGGQSVTIGRGPGRFEDGHIQVRGLSGAPGFSRRHAYVFKSGNEWVCSTFPESGVDPNYKRKGQSLHRIDGGGPLTVATLEVGSGLVLYQSKAQGSVFLYVDGIEDTQFPVTSDGKVIDPTETLIEVFKGESPGASPVEADPEIYARIQALEQAVLLINTAYAKAVDELAEQRAEDVRINARLRRISKMLGVALGSLAAAALLVMHNGNVQEETIQNVVIWILQVVEFAAMGAAVKTATEGEN